MKIVMLVSSLGAGGAERVAATLCNAWGQRGDQVTLVSTFSGGAGVPFYPLSRSVELISVADRIPPSAGRKRHLRRLMELRRLILERRPHVVISFLPNVNIAAIAATALTGIPRVICERSDPAAQPIGLFWYWACKLLYRFADVVCVQTEQVAKSIGGIYGGLRQVSSIPNPLPPELVALPPVAGAPQSLSGRKVLLSLGRLSSEKRVDSIIDAFRLLADRHQDWDLHIVGDGPLRCDLQAQVESTGLPPDRIRLLGRSSNPWEHMQRATAFVLASAYEGFPNALLEAVALGLPSVSVDCRSGPRDISDDGAVVKLVAPGDESAFVRALEEIMTDSDLRSRLAQQGATSVRRRYGLASVLQRWDLLFENITEPLNGGIHRTRVVHIISGLGRGGAEGALTRLIAEHAANPRFKHEVISLTSKGVYGDSLERMGVVVHALELNHLTRLAFALPRLIRLLRLAKADIVQTWMVHSDLLGGIAARMASRRLVWGIRTTDYSVESRSTRAIRSLCAGLSRFLPDKIVCAAQASLESSLQAGYDEKKMFVIPNGFDVKCLRRHAGSGLALRQQFGIAPGTVLVGCLGRYNPAKDHANFVRAAGILAARYSAVSFLMVGRDLETRNHELRRLIEETGFPDRFLLLGERSDPASCLDAMDIFVLSSSTEGFPNALGEAMAMAVPCVSTNVGDSALLLGECGFLVPPRDSIALADGVARFLEMPDHERHAMARRGRERVEREFSLTAVAQRYGKLYDELMASA